MERDTRFQEVRLRGYAVCPGIAIAPGLYYLPQKEFAISELTVPAEKIDGEVSRYYSALHHSRRDLKSLRDRLLREGGGETAAIVSAHIEITRDPLMTQEVEKEIRKHQKNTEYVFSEVIGAYEKKFQKIENIFFRERLADVRDISRRVLGHLNKQTYHTLSHLDKSAVIFAQVLSPGDTAEAHKEHVLGFVTRTGSETSHVAIMARAQNKPYVSNIDFPDCEHFDLVILDGNSGLVILHPEEETLKYYQEILKRDKQQKAVAYEQVANRVHTRDNHKVCLSVNIAGGGEVDSMHSSMGVGLFRSEYLFLVAEGFPSEEEQFASYRKLVETMAGCPCVIRTFDIGGDKLGKLEASNKEKNPYLGCRATRYMLKERDQFKRQIRAILRASAFGQIRILFPMISGVSEFREARNVVEEVKKELLKEKIPFAHNIPLGSMIEVPSAALTADLLAQEGDFLSLGTNDLVQYALAVERGNAAMSYLYTPAHPSIVRMIKLVVDGARKADTPVSICGEVAADPHFTPLLLGLGVKELSVSLSALPKIRKTITLLSMRQARRLANKILACETVSDIEDILEKEYQKIHIKLISDESKF